MRIYGMMTVLTIAFCVIYEYNSDGVYSGYMISLPFYPLFGGVLVFWIIYHLKKEVKPTWICRCSYHLAVVSLSMASFIQGVLDISGADSDFIGYYWYMGKFLLIVSILSFYHSSKEIGNGEV